MKKIVVFLTLVMVLTLSPCMSAAEFNLKIGHDQPIAQSYHAGSVFFAKRVEELTNGRVKVTVFPGAQLGDELSMIDSLRLGDLDFSIAAVPNMATHVKELGFFSVSYLFKDKDHFLTTLTDDTFINLIQGKVKERNIGFQILSFLTCGLRNTYNIRRPINNMEDLKGLKMRVMASPIEAQVWKTLGTSPISIPFGDIYSGLQAGLIEGAEGSASSYFTAKHHELAKYYSLTGHQWLVTALNVSDKTWNKLPEDIKAAIKQAALEMTVYEVNHNVAEDEELVLNMQTKYGVKVNKPDITPFQNELKALQDGVARDLGMEDVLQRIRELQN